MHLLRSDHAIPFAISAGYAVVTIPSLHIAEMVHLKLG